MSAPVQPTALDRLLTALRNLIRAEFPQYTYSGCYEYSIQAVNSSTGAIDAQPTDGSISLPSLANVTMGPSILGEMAQATMGNTCLVEFINADPTKPRIIGLNPTNFNGTIDAATQVNVGPSASQVNLGAAQMPMARTTDTCSVYFPPGSSITIVGVTIPPGGVISASVQFITDPISNTPLPCVGLIGPASTTVFS